MKTKTTTLVLALLCAFISFDGLAQGGGGTLGPTFFSEAELNTILKPGNCSDIRFYNVIEPGTNNMTVMAIGVKSPQGKEINGLFGGAKNYKIYKGVSGSNGIYSSVAKGEAQNAVGAVITSGQPACAAYFTRDEIEEMLKGDANGVQLTPVTEGANNSFKAEAAEAKDGSFSPLEGGSSYMCSEPCPTFCGDDGVNFLNK